MCQRTERQFICGETLYTLKKKFVHMTYNQSLHIRRSLHIMFLYSCRKLRGACMGSKKILHFFSFFFAPLLLLAG